MATFTNSYIEPGVYVETELRPSAVTGVAGPFIPCLVGSVDDYKKITATAIRGTSTKDSISFNNENILFSSINLNREIIVRFGNLTYRRVLDVPQNVSAILQENGTLDEDTTYYYRVTALNNDGETLGSQEVSATTSTTHKSIKISWSPVYGATKYRIYGRTTQAQNKYWEVASDILFFVDDDIDSGTAGTVPTTSVVIGDYDVIKDNSNGQVKIEWVGSSEPLEGSTYEVIFYVAKIDPDDYAPVLYYNTEISKMYDFLGNISWNTSTGKPMYELPLMASLSFANGASAVWCVPKRQTDTIESLLEVIQSLKSPLPYSLVFSGGYQRNVTSDLSTSAITSILNHVNIMSSITEQKERILLLGAPLNADQDANLKNNYMETIQSLKNRRLVYCYPSNVLVDIDNISREVNGSYLAAAISGLIDSVGIGNPLTGQVVSGIMGVKDMLLRQIKNQIAQYGLLIVEDSLRIRHALTTDNSSFLSKELKVTRIVDYVSRIVRSALEGFVNQPYSGGFVSTIGASIKLVLTQLLNANVIYEYGSINIVRNESEPNQLDVAFSIKPTPDTNWTYVKISVQS